MRTHHPVPGPDACGTCRYFASAAPSLDRVGECRRRAPVIVPLASPSTRAHWPEVDPSEGCGDFERAYSPPLNGA